MYRAPHSRSAAASYQELQLPAMLTEGRFPLLSSASTGPRFLLVYIALTGYSGYVIPQGSTEKTASFSALP